MIEFTLPFVPRPLKRASVGRVGRFARMFDPAENRDRKANVVQFALPHAPPAPIEGPVSVAFEFVLPPPASWTKKHREEWLYRPCKAPDLSNLVKLVEDAITECGRFWRDDAQICASSELKRFGPEPMTVVRIARMGPAAEGGPS